MHIGHCSKSFEASAEVLQFAAFTNASHEGVPVDSDDGLQQAYGRLRQRIEGLFRGRKQTLQVGDGGLSGLTLDPQGLVAPHRVDACPGRVLLGRAWKRMSCESIPFSFG